MISLENISIQILYGLIAVTISFVAIVRQAGVKPLSSLVASSLKLSAPKPKRPRTSVRTGRIRARSRSNSRGRTIVQSSRTRKARRRLRSKPRGAEEDSRNSMRNLLQMLVPPRAFGLRHQHRIVNPLSHVIQTLEESRSGLIHPLK